MIEIVRIATPDGPTEESAWTVHRPATFDDASKLMKARFIHAVVIDDALATDFVKKLYSYYEYPFPRDRLLSIHPPGRAWCEPAGVGCVLDQPWQTSLQAYFDAHPEMAASAWRSFELDNPSRLDEAWMARAMLPDYETHDVRKASWYETSRRAFAGLPTGHACAHLIAAMTPNYYLTAYARSFVRYDDNAVKLRPLAEWIAACPLLGIRQMAFHLVEELDLHEGKVVALPKDPIPFAPLKTEEGEWSSQEAPTLSPTTLGLPLDPPLTTAPPNLSCRACGSSDVGQACGGVVQDYRDGMIDDIGLAVELRCRTCKAYSRYFCSYPR